MTAIALLPPDENERTGRRIVFHRKGWMKTGTMTLSVQTTDVSEQVVGLMMDTPVKIGRSCSIHFRTLVGGRIATLNLTGAVAYCTLVGLKGYRVGILMDHTSQENAGQLDMILSARP